MAADVPIQRLWRVIVLRRAPFAIIAVGADIQKSQVRVAVVLLAQGIYEFAMFAQEKAAAVLRFRAAFGFHHARPLRQQPVRDGWAWAPRRRLRGAHAKMELYAAGVGFLAQRFDGAPVEYIRRGLEFVPVETGVAHCFRESVGQGARILPANARIGQIVADGLGIKYRCFGRGGRRYLGGAANVLSSGRRRRGGGRICRQRRLPAGDQQPEQQPAVARQLEKGGQREVFHRVQSSGSHRRLISLKRVCHWLASACITPKAR